VHKSKTTFEKRVDFSAGGGYLGRVFVEIDVRSETFFVTRASIVREP